MQAAFYEQKGAARDVLRVGDIPTPIPGPGEVLVRVQASSVNPSDTKTRSGWRATAAMPYPRIVPHQDGAGVIDAVGDGVPRTRVGERVWLYEAQWQRPFGTAAEFVTLAAARAVRLPDGVTFAEGACLGIPAMTAHRCVFGGGPVSGQTILVTGGAGAVGFYAIQFAKWGGATVIATVSSEEKAARARDAGADHVVNYRTENVAERVQELAAGGVHRVVEVALGPNLPTSVAALRPNGAIAAYASDDNPEPTLPFRPMLGKDLTLHTVLVYVMPRAAKDQAIADITTCLEHRLLRHQTAAELPLREVAAAHEMVESGRRMGAVLLTL